MKIKYLSLFLVNFSMYCAEWEVAFTCASNSENEVVLSKEWFEEATTIGFYLLNVPKGYNGDASLDLTPDIHAKLTAMLQGKLFRNMFIMDETKTKTPKKINIDSFKDFSSFEELASLDSTITITDSKGHIYKKNTKNLTHNKAPILVLKK